MTLQNLGADRVSVTRQLVDAMMALADVNRPPSRLTVEDFAGEFVRAVIGKRLTSAQLSIFQRSIAEVMGGSTANFNSASRLRATLTALRVDSSETQMITKSVLAIGEEVRGPDDSPVLKFLK